MTRSPRHLTTITIPLAACIVALISMRGTAQPGTPVPITTATISPVVPTEVVDGAGAPVPVAVSALPIQFFDDFSWRSFLALNWPANTSGRGEADTAKKIGDAGPRVWDTWKTDYETYQPAGQTPTDWNSFDAVTPCADVPFADGGKTRMVAAFSKFGTLNQADFGFSSNPLVAQNHTYVRYEVRTNRAEFDFIRDKRLFLRSELEALTSPLRFTPGSIEIKAAWRELTAELPAARSRYYVERMSVQSPMNHDLCEPRDLALVGFHIVQKTPLRPQWVWSSFEHVDNVPEGPMAPGAQFSFNDGDQAHQMLTPPNPPAALSLTNPPQANPVPMQVVRALPIHPMTLPMNRRYQAALAGTVWANYQLVVTEWPTKTVDPTKPFPEDISGNPFPGLTATTSMGNTTMETYFQAGGGDGASCMVCHDSARAEKTDFVWFINIRAFPPKEEKLKALSQRINSMRRPVKPQ